MRLRLAADYRGTVDPDTDGQGGFKAGEEINVSDHIGEYLLRAGTSSFERVDEKPAKKTKAVEDAPNRMETGGETR